MSQIKKNFTSNQYTVSYPVGEDYDGKRLDQFLMQYLSSFSRENIKKKITSGDVTIVGRPHPHKASTKVYQGEEIILKTERGELEDEYWRGEKLELVEHPEVIFEDENVVIISKPPYMSTHPTGKHLFYCATVYFETKYRHTIHSVHRLDRETSGLLMLAKNPKVANYLTPLFEEKKVKKCYFFIAHKNKDKDRTSFPFTAIENLGPRDDFVPRNFIHCFPKDSKQGKKSETDFELLIENNEYAIGLAYPKTGRQHQIRAHAAHHGYPLLGDKLYNGDPKVFQRFKDMIPKEEDFELMQISRHALHAIGVRIPYPQGQNQVFSTPIPHDLTQWIHSSFDKSLKIDELEELIRSKIEKYFSI